MALIDFQNVCVDFPIYNSTGRSLKKRLIGVATGGQLSEDTLGIVIIRALDNLSFKINDGERVALLGHNGAGKSTLLRVMSSVYAPTFGSAHIQGKLGSLIDISLGIDHEISGLENIYIRGRLLGLSASEIKEKMPEIIEFSELGDAIHWQVKRYSTGMMSRLSFSIAIMKQPEILLIDEVLSVGDIGFQHKCLKKVSDIKEAGATIIFVSHNFAEAQNMCSKAALVNNGTITHYGDINEIGPIYHQLFEN